MRFYLKKYYIELAAIVVFTAIVIELIYSVKTAAANTPLFPGTIEVNTPYEGLTCQRWYKSWREDKAVLRTAVRLGMKQGIDATIAERGASGPKFESWNLCMLMNVDYIINTTLSRCDEGIPLNLAALMTFQAVDDLCAAGL